MLPETGYWRNSALSATGRATDILIVGGGPAGLAAAIAARDKGFQVTVADGAAPPVEKPCGEGMMPETLAALENLGVRFPAGVGVPFRGLSFIQQAASVHADFPAGRGLGLRRTCLHEQLLRRAEESGAQILWNTAVTALDGTVVRLTSGTMLARWIIGADGYASRVRRWSGLSLRRRTRQRFANRRHYRVTPWSDRMEVYWGRFAQAYVTPVSGQEVCVVTMAATAKQAKFTSALETIPDLRQRLCGAQLVGRERGAVSSAYTLSRVFRGNVALVGDASGGVDAITGEGLRLAFQQALALADALEAGDLSRYQRVHEKFSRRPRLMGKLLVWLGRHPEIRDRFLRTLQRQPELFSRMLSIHVGRSEPAEFIAAGVQLGLRLLTS